MSQIYVVSTAVRRRGRWCASLLLIPELAPGCKRERVCSILSKSHQPRFRSGSGRDASQPIARFPRCQGHVETVRHARGPDDRPRGRARGVGATPCPCGGGGSGGSRQAVIGGCPRGGTFGRRGRRAGRRRVALAILRIPRRVRPPPSRPPAPRRARCTSSGSSPRSRLIFARSSCPGRTPTPGAATTRWTGSCVDPTRASR